MKNYNPDSTPEITPEAQCVIDAAFERTKLPVPSEWAEKHLPKPINFSEFYSEFYAKIMEDIGIPAIQAIQKHNGSWSASGFMVQIRRWHTVPCEQNSIIGLA